MTRLAKGTILIPRRVHTESDLGRAWRVIRSVRGIQESGRGGRSYEVEDPRDTLRKALLTTMDAEMFAPMDAHGLMLGLTFEDLPACDCGEPLGACVQCSFPLFTKACNGGEEVRVCPGCGYDLITLTPTRSWP